MSLRCLAGPVPINERQRWLAENAMKSGLIGIRLRAHAGNLIASQMVLFGAGHVGREFCADEHARASMWMA